MTSPAMTSLIAISSARKTRQRGSTTVETGLVLLLLMMLTLGVVELGRAMWTYNTLSHAARAALRYTLVHGSQSPVTAPQVETVAEANAPGLAAADLNVITSYSPNNQRGSTVTVRVSYPFRFVVSPALGNTLATLNLTSESSGIISQ